MIHCFVKSGDRGIITSDNLEIEVTKTLKDATGLIIHLAKIKNGNLNSGQG